ncbi:MAG: ATPase domain-containing protein [Candidatus Micrarchaeia archaeon]
MAEPKKIQIGISGIDDMLNGGIPKRHHVLVSGGPGSGKTLFCFEYLYRGAKKGEKGLFITLEEDPELIVENVKSAFSGLKDIDSMVDKDIFIIKPAMYDFKNFSDILQSYVVHHGVKRVVIDSSTLLRFSFEEVLEFRKKLIEFLSFLRNLDCTALITSELENPVRNKMKFNIEQFAADGIIVLYNMPRKEKRIRALEIIKMRGTDHSRDLVPMKITSQGITVFPGEKIY